MHHVWTKGVDPLGDLAAGFDVPHRLETGAHRRQAHLLHRRQRVQIDRVTAFGQQLCLMRQHFHHPTLGLVVVVQLQDAHEVDLPVEERADAIPAGADWTRSGYIPLSYAARRARHAHPRRASRSMSISR